MPQTTDKKDVWRIEKRIRIPSGVITEYTSARLERNREREEDGLVLGFYTEKGVFARLLGTELYREKHRDVCVNMTVIIKITVWP